MDHSSSLILRPSQLTQLDLGYHSSSLFTVAFMLAPQLKLVLVHLELEQQLGLRLVLVVVQQLVQQLELIFILLLGLALELQLELAFIEQLGLA